MNSFEKLIIPVNMLFQIVILPIQELKGLDDGSLKKDIDNACLQR